MTHPTKDELDQEHVSHSATVKVGESYGRHRQQAVSASYRVWGKQEVFPERNRNWVHYRRAAALIARLGARVEDFIAAQFLTATPTSYPYPSNLYSKRAVENYRAAVSSVGAAETLRVMELHLVKYEKMFQQSRQELVYVPGLPFTAWFRVLFMDPVDVPRDLAQEALRAFKDPGIRRALREANYDVRQAEVICQKSVGA